MIANPPVRSKGVRAAARLRVWITLSLVLPACALAGDWTFVPRANLSQAYTDNVRLSEFNRLDDLITTVQPGMTIRGESKRLDVNADYNLQYLKYLDNTEFDDLFHQLQANGELMLFGDVLYFTGGSRMSQQNTSNGDAFVPSNRSQTGNRTNVIQYQFGPELRTSFGRWADLEASYIRNTNDRGAVNDPAIADRSTDEDVMRFDLNSGAHLPRTPITVSYSSRKQKNFNGTSSLRRLSGEVGYKLNRVLEFNGEGGTEWNQFASGRNNREGPFWNVGGTWTPSERTSLRGRYGNRFFGNNFSIDASHRMRRVVMTFKYQEQVRTTNQIQSEVELVPLEDAFGNPVVDIDSATSISSPFEIPSLGDDVVISRDIRATLFYEGRRRTFQFTFFEGDSNFEAAGVSEVNRGLTFNLNHELTANTSAVLSGLWRETSGRRASTNTLRLTPSIRTTLGRHITLNLNYEYVDGKGRTREFTEHSVTADIAYQF